MSRLKRSDATRIIKSIEECMGLCRTLPTDRGFARLEPIVGYLRQIVEDLINKDEWCDSLEFDYYLNECNEDIKETFRLLGYLVIHSEGEPRKVVLDIQKRLTKIRSEINWYFSNDV
jgi:hypothetical protein